MNLFKLKTEIRSFPTFKEAFSELHVNEKDLLITIKEIYEPFFKEMALPCTHLFVGDYGLGEPTDGMIDAMLRDLEGVTYDRVIAVGGGSVIDISKIFVLKDVTSAQAAFEQSIPIIKDKKLVILPATAGTGSEVTNISIAFLEKKNVKMGLANDAIVADEAVLVAQAMEKLPMKPYACSAIDALIHAMESYLSPKANEYTQVFSKKAIEMILRVFRIIVEKGPEARLDYLHEMLIASNMAGIAFGNAGVGAVHAMSYPLGGNYHVPHGEANYQFLVAVFDAYTSKNPNGAIKELNEYIAGLLGVSVDEVYPTLAKILNKLVDKKPLREYGMKEEEIEIFADSVIATQQRLLANNYVPLSRDEIRDIYRDIF